MPNPVYAYIHEILFVNEYFVDKRFKQTWAHLFAHSQMVSSIAMYH